MANKWMYFYDDDDDFMLNFNILGHHIASTGSNAVPLTQRCSLYFLLLSNCVNSSDFEFLLASQT